MNLTKARDRPRHLDFVRATKSLALLGEAIHSSRSTTLDDLSRRQPVNNRNGCRFLAERRQSRKLETDLAG
jgi:hypothetical protein